MLKLKQVAQRATALVGAVAMLSGVTAAALLPAGMAAADALNPLTERSLTLSSSSPGWSYTDGSGNQYNPAISAGYSPYAAPNTGANGQKTGETLGFRVSSGATIKAFDAQYCTTPSGDCIAPGDDAVHGTDTSTTSDFKFTASGTPDTGTNSGTDGDLTGANGDAVLSTWVEGNYTTIQSDPGSVPDPGDPASYSKPGDLPGQYVILDSTDGSTWSQSTGWTLTVGNNEDNTQSGGTKTGQDNYVILSNPTGVALTPGEYIKIIFYATYGGYITNPGSGAFFARLNTYSNVSNTDSKYVAGANEAQFPYVASVNSADIVDGGVTVANVMNESIQIQTKVLETMDFSVGTVDPDTLDSAQLNTALGHVSPDACDPILTSMDPANDPANTLDLGNTAASNSLSTNDTFATHSYFRLSTNSSKGATVYYSGTTLTNTEGDQIAAIGTSAKAPSPSTAQFGLALDNTSATTGGNPGDYPISYAFAKDSAGDGSGTWYENGADKTAAGYTTGTEDGGADSGTGLSYNWTNNKPAAAHNPGLWPLVPETGYGNPATGQGGGYGGINSIVLAGSPPTTVETIGSDYAFDPNSNTVPAALATESNQVIDCVTGKVRYIADIAATTPAGIYTTKINYIAAPKY